MAERDTHSNESAAPRGSQRRWSTQIAAGALAVQALVYVGVTVITVMQVNWELPLEELLNLDAAYVAVLTVLMLAPVIAALLVAALLALVRPPVGWTVAQFVQTVVLLVGVQLYYADSSQVLSSTWRDLLMFGSILVVIYLNSPEGRLLLARRAQPAAPSKGAAAAHG